MKIDRKLALVLVALLISGVASAQSLADAARRNKGQRRSAAQKVYTNDDFTSSAPLIPGSTKEGGLSTMPEQAPQSSESRAEDQAKATDRDEAEAEETSAEKRAKLIDEWKSKVRDQQKHLAEIEREVNLMEREHQVRVAAYYADAGNQLRDSRKWFEQEKKYEDDHSAKQKELEEAKQKLADMKEEARKAGVPLGALE